MKSKPTIKDVARRVGVSTATVSYVINKKGGKVSPQIQEKVLEAVKEMGYRKNYSALGLVSNRSKLIGVVIPQTEEANELQLNNPFYSSFIGALEYHLRRQGFHLILSGTKVANTDVSYLESLNVDGIIILGIYQDDFYDSLKDLEVPVVLVDSYINDEYFCRVRIDDEEGGYKATRYLIEKGHKSIGYVCGSIKKDGVSEKRFSGYRAALEEAGIPLDEGKIYEGNVTYDWGRQVVDQIIDDPQISAVFAGADVLAAGILSACYDKAIAVPEKLSVIGFDDVFLARMMTPALTTVKQDIREKAALSAKALLSMINNGSYSENEIVLPVKIVERQTVREILR